MQLQETCKLFMYRGYLSSARTKCTPLLADSPSKPPPLTLTRRCRMSAHGQYCSHAQQRRLPLGGQSSKRREIGQNRNLDMHNSGASFIKVGDTFPGRYEGQLVHIPNTNWLVLIGGYGSDGVHQHCVSVDRWSWSNLGVSGPDLADRRNAIAGSIAFFDSQYSGAEN